MQTDESRRHRNRASHVLMDVTVIVDGAWLVESDGVGVAALQVGRGECAVRAEDAVCDVVAIGPCDRGPHGCIEIGGAERKLGDRHFDDQCSMRSATGFVRPLAELTAATTANALLARVAVMATITVTCKGFLILDADLMSGLDGGDTGPRFEVEATAGGSGGHRPHDEFR